VITDILSKTQLIVKDQMNIWLSFARNLFQNKQKTYENTTHKLDLRLKIQIL